MALKITSKLNAKSKNTKNIQIKTVLQIKKNKNKNFTKHHLRLNLLVCLLSLDRSYIITNKQPS